MANTMTYELCERILNTLPISYYLKHKINVELQPLAPSSYYNTMEEKIVVSYAQLNNLSYLYNDSTTYEEFENDIRCMLYHEISHAILTTKACDNYWFINYHDIMNIFEDQRIETILKDFYMRVDFSSFVKRICNYEPNKTPQTPIQLFFNLVRFQEYNNNIEKGFVDMANNIILSYANVNSQSTHSEFNDYCCAIYTFYQIVEKYFNDMFGNNTNQNQLNNQNNIGNDSDASQSCGAIQNAMNNGNENQNSQNTTNGSKENNGNENSQNTMNNNNNVKNNDNSTNSNNSSNSTNGKGNGGNNQNTNNENSLDTPPTRIGELLKNQEIMDLINNAIENAINDMFMFDNGNFKNQIERILFSRTKDTGNHKGCTSAYSGKLDPRLYGTNREPYKWCVHNGGTKLAKAKPLRLNLFIDNSGSFYTNELIVNKMLKELQDLERKMQDFEMTFTTINTYVVEHDKHDRMLHCTGGTRLQENIVPIFKKLNTDNYTNYNIVLFDGRCKNEHLFRTFNTNNTILISDYDNKKAIDSYCPNARKRIFTYNYTDELEKNVIECLECLIR